MEIDINSAIIGEDDWRSPIITYLRYPTLPSEKRVRIMASNYLMWNEDLVRKSKDEVLLRCLGKKEYMKVMGETHEGICGAHQGGRKIHGPIQQAPSVPMNPVVKPWPFRGWAMDLIGKIYPASNQRKTLIDTLNKLLAGKQAVSRAYNKRVKNKSFEEGEIVWKAVLPLGTHIAGYGKWSPTWEGPFIINQILGMGAYRSRNHARTRKVALVLELKPAPSPFRTSPHLASCFEVHQSASPVCLR
ncbi:unnamed protein product [Prunus brigantina]